MDKRITITKEVRDAPRWSKNQFDDYWIIRIDGNEVMNFKAIFNEKTRVERWVRENLTVSGIKQYYKDVRWGIKQEIKELQKTYKSLDKREKEQLKKRNQYFKNG